MVPPPKKKPKEEEDKEPDPLPPTPPQDTATGSSEPPGPPQSISTEVPRRVRPPRGPYAKTRNRKTAQPKTNMDGTPRKKYTRSGKFTKAAKLAGIAQPGTPTSSGAMPQDSGNPMDSDESDSGSFPNMLPANCPLRNPNGACVEFKLPDHILERARGATERAPLTSPASQDPMDEDDFEVPPLVHYEEDDPNLIFQNPEDEVNKKETVEHLDIKTSVLQGRVQEVMTSSEDSGASEDAHENTSATFNASSTLDSPVVQNPVTSELSSHSEPPKEPERIDLSKIFESPKDFEATDRTLRPFKQRASQTSRPEGVPIVGRNGRILKRGERIAKLVHATHVFPRVRGGVNKKNELFERRSLHACASFCEGPTSEVCPLFCLVEEFKKQFMDLEDMDSPHEDVEEEDGNSGDSSGEAANPDVERPTFGDLGKQMEFGTFGDVESNTHSPESCSHRPTYSSNVEGTPAGKPEDARSSTRGAPTTDSVQHEDVGEESEAFDDPMEALDAKERTVQSLEHSSQYTPAGPQICKMIDETLLTSSRITSPFLRAGNNYSAQGQSSSVETRWPIQQVFQRTSRWPNILCHRFKKTSRTLPRSLRDVMSARKQTPIEYFSAEASRNLKHNQINGVPTSSADGLPGGHMDQDRLHSGSMNPYYSPLSVVEQSAGYGTSRMDPAAPIDEHYPEDQLFTSDPFNESNESSVISKTPYPNVDAVDASSDSIPSTDFGKRIMGSSCVQQRGINGTSAFPLGVPPTDQTGLSSFQHNGISPSSLDDPYFEAPLAAEPSSSFPSDPSEYKTHGLKFANTLPFDILNPALRELPPSDKNETLAAVDPPKTEFLQHSESSCFVGPSIEMPSSGIDNNPVNHPRESVDYEIPLSDILGGAHQVLSGYEEPYFDAPTSTEFLRPVNKGASFNDPSPSESSLHEVKDIWSLPPSAEALSKQTTPEKEPADIFKSPIQDSPETSPHEVNAVEIPKPPGHTDPVPQDSTKLTTEEMRLAEKPSVDTKILEFQDQPEYGDHVSTLSGRPSPAQEDQTLQNLLESSTNGMNIVAEIPMDASETPRSENSSKLPNDVRRHAPEIPLSDTNTQILVRFGEDEAATQSSGDKPLMEIEEQRLSDSSTEIPFTDSTCVAHEILEETGTRDLTSEESDGTSLFDINAHDHQGSLEANFDEEAFHEFAENQPAEVDAQAPQNPMGVDADEATAENPKDYEKPLPEYRYNATFAPSVSQALQSSTELQYSQEVLPTERYFYQDGPSQGSFSTYHEQSQDSQQKPQEEYQYNAHFAEKEDTVTAGTSAGDTSKSLDTVAQAHCHYQFSRPEQSERAFITDIRRSLSMETLNFLARPRQSRSEEQPRFRRPEPREHVRSLSSNPPERYSGPMGKLYQELYQEKLRRGRQPLKQDFRFEDLEIVGRDSGASSGISKSTDLHNKVMNPSVSKDLPKESLEKMDKLWMDLSGEPLRLRQNSTCQDFKLESSDDTEGNSTVNPDVVEDPETKILEDVKGDSDDSGNPKIEETPEEKAGDKLEDKNVNFEDSVIQQLNSEDPNKPDEVSEEFEIPEDVIDKSKDHCEGSDDPKNQDEESEGTNKPKYVAKNSKDSEDSHDTDGSEDVLEVAPEDPENPDEDSENPKNLQDVAENDGYPDTPCNSENDIRDKEYSDDFEVSPPSQNPQDQSPGDLQNDQDCNSAVQADEDQNPQLLNLGPQNPQNHNLQIQSAALQNAQNPIPNQASTDVSPPKSPHVSVNSHDPENSSALPRTRCSIPKPSKTRDTGNCSTPKPPHRPSRRFTFKWGASVGSGELGEGNGESIDIGFLTSETSQPENPTASETSNSGATKSVAHESESRRRPTPQRSGPSEASTSEPRIFKRLSSKTRTSKIKKPRRHRQDYESSSESDSDSDSIGPDYFESSSDSDQDDHGSSGPSGSSKRSKNQQPDSSSKFSNVESKPSTSEPRSSRSTRPRSSGNSKSHQISKSKGAESAPSTSEVRNSRSRSTRIRIVGSSQSSLPSTSGPSVSQSTKSDPSTSESISRRRPRSDTPAPFSGEKSRPSQPRKKLSKAQQRKDDLKAAKDAAIARNVAERGVDFESESEFRVELKKQPLGFPEFMEVFEKGEHKFIKNEDVKITIHENGKNFVKKLGKFDSPHLFKNKKGLGMVIPEGLSLANLEDFVDLNAKVHAIDSYTQLTYDTTMGAVIESIKKPGPRDRATNVLSYEFSNSNLSLKDSFKLPLHVSQNSMVDLIEQKLNEKLQAIQEKLKTLKNKAEIELQREKMKRIQNKLDTIPRYEKFLLVSMKDSFTSVHVDLSATSVYYHVIEGKKIFYVAPPTPKNLEIYKKFETRKAGDGWIGEELFKEFQRVEINKGETAMIPSGWLHYVYTPEDSLVVGGNFLIEQYLKKQFQLTDLEEKALKAKFISSGNMFLGFYNIMWAYAEMEVIPKLGDGHRDPETIDSATALLAMDPNKKEADPKKVEEWYTVEEKEEILKKLNEAVAVLDGRKRGAPVDNSQPGTSSTSGLPRKMAKRGN